MRQTPSEGHIDPGMSPQRVHNGRYPRLPGWTTLQRMRRWPIGLVLWLLLLAAAEAVLFVIIWRFFVRTEHGQLLDTVALTGNRIGRTHISGVVDTVLNTMTVVSITAATAAVGFIALARR